MPRALFPIDVKPGLIVAGYSPIRSEIDPTPLMDRLHRDGARLVLPTVTGRDQPLTFRQWTPGEDLMRGEFGILQPSADAPVLAPNIVLVPLVAFDRSGHRIGYGAGYYDRTFELLRRWAATVAVGLGFSIQEVNAVPALPHDARLDYIVTERETIDTGRSPDVSGKPVPTSC